MLPVNNSNQMSKRKWINCVARRLNTLLLAELCSVNSCFLVKHVHQCQISLCRWQVKSVKSKMYYNKEVHTTQIALNSLFVNVIPKKNQWQGIEWFSWTEKLVFPWWKMRPSLLIAEILKVRRFTTKPSCMKTCDGRSD